MLGLSSNQDTPDSSSAPETNVRSISDNGTHDGVIDPSGPAERQNAGITFLHGASTSRNELAYDHEHGMQTSTIGPETDNELQRRPATLSNLASITDATPVTVVKASIGSTPDPPPPPPPPQRGKEKAVRWRDLPKKGQLAILTLARLSEPLTQTSLQSYMFYQLRSFDPSLEDSAISSQIGILQGCFTFAQFMTAILWGRISDAQWAGRKRVLLVGLLGTGVSSVGFGFSRSFAWAIFWRTLGGALNGNVGVMRTMISEIIKQKKFQSRAFLLLPMCFNIGRYLLLPPF